MSASSGVVGKKRIRLDHRGQDATGSAIRETGDGFFEGAPRGWRGGRIGAAGVRTIRARSASEGMRRKRRNPRWRVGLVSGGRSGSGKYEPEAPARECAGAPQEAKQSSLPRRARSTPAPLFAGLASHWSGTTSGTQRHIKRRNPRWRVGLVSGGRRGSASPGCQAPGKCKWGADRKRSNLPLPRRARSTPSGAVVRGARLALVGYDQWHPAPHKATEPSLARRARIRWSQGKI